MRAQITYLEPNGGTMLVRRCGQGQGQGQVLLMLHAGVADSRMWRPQFDGLCQQYRLIAPDLRGYGRSPLPNSAFSHLADLKFVLDKFRKTQAWIVGNSFGSYLAANFALKFLDRVDGLILLAPTVGGFAADHDIESYWEHERKLLTAGDIEQATELNMRVWFDGPYRSASEVDSGLRQQLAVMQREAFRQPEPAGVEFADEAIKELDRYASLHRPVMIIVGDQDQPAVLDHADELHAVLPQSKLKVIKGAGHLLSLERPDEVNELIRMEIDRH